MILFLVQTIQRDSAISFPMLGDFSINPPSSFSLFGLNIYFYGVIIALIILLILCATLFLDMEPYIQFDSVWSLLQYTPASLAANVTGMIYPFEASIFPLKWLKSPRAL